MDEGDRRYPGWRVVLACAVGAFCASAPYQAFAVFLKPIVEEFSWSREAASGAYGVMALLAAAAAAPVGHLLDRHGARRIVIASLSLSGLGVASLALLTPSLTHLYVVCGAIGVATIGASPVAYSRAIFSWFDRRRGRALGLMLSGAALASVVQAPIATALIAALGWRAAWLVFSALTLAVGVPMVMRLLHERDAHGAMANRAQGATLTEALRTRQFWTLILVVLGSAVLSTGTLVHLAALLTDRGISAGSAAAVLSIMGAANLAGRLSTGWLIDRYPAPRVAAVLLTTMAAGALVLARAQSIETAAVAALMIGLGTGGEIDINPYLLSRYFGMRSLSTLFGFNWMALGLAAAIGPVLMGRAFDATRSYEAILTQLAMLTIAAAMLMLTLTAPGPISPRRSDHEDRVA